MWRVAAQKTSLIKNKETNRRKFTLINFSYSGFTKVLSKTEKANNSTFAGGKS